MGITADHVTAIAASVSACGVGLIYWQAKILNAATKADHERTRRQAAVSMLQLWDERLSRRASMARKIGESLSFAQAKSLFLQEQFELDRKVKESLIAVIPEFSEESAGEGNKIVVSSKYSTLLRWELVSYLNSLETILSAWQHNIADRAMIEEQFEYLVRPEDGHYLLKSFREAAGGVKTYPCIAAFVQHLERKHVAIKGKEKVYP